MTAAVVVLADYRGLEVSFTGEGWFNATTAAAKFGRRPGDWLKLPETRRYMKALTRSFEGKKSPLKRVDRGTTAGGGRGGGNTWLHPKLAVRFAQWLDVDFAVWCDEQIENIIHGRPAVSIGLYAQRIAFEGVKARSEQKGSIGARLMNERKREKPALSKADDAWRLTMEPGLFAKVEQIAA